MIGRHETTTNETFQNSKRIIKVKYYVVIFYIQDKKKFFDKFGIFSNVAVINEMEGDEENLNLATLQN